MDRSLHTTVVTPRKCPGRNFPSSLSAMRPTSTKVSKPTGYISSSKGTKTTSTPASSSFDRSASRSLGYVEKSPSGSNCVGFTKMLTATVVFSALARCTRAMWPSCRKPMVGTRPRALDAPWQELRNSSMVSVTCISETCFNLSSGRNPTHPYAGLACWPASSSSTLRFILKLSLSDGNWPSRTSLAYSDTADMIVSPS